MAMKMSFAFAALCLVGVVFETEASFIKGGKNVPRVGRSNEADGPFDHSMGYVIKTIPSKNIPRMGRRNYDSENRYDIPKLFEMPVETAEFYEGEGISPLNQEELAAYYENQIENMKK
ncbi:hypothetical protein JYU34_001182 [Plutella xylostella]|uniref:Uncharacterized protein n=2 Tax=Plutella xylostella TaxID=51655 RepID=A0ABQ7R669_PLUXY|nr:hypothetical protein JYU34_001182 [Plutella xylostella]